MPSEDVRVSRKSAVGILRVCGRGETEKKNLKPDSLDGLPSIKLL